MRRSTNLLGLFTLLLVLVTPAMANDPPQTLFDFTTPDAAKDWQTVNDGVMGGVSTGTFKITQRQTLEFTGTLSLANNGGFASVRTKPKPLGLRPGDALLVKVKGDGRDYTLNLYLDRPLIAFSYRAALPTKKGEWVEVRLPLDQFEATSFGRVVKNAGAVKPAEVNALGVMLSDKKAGPFQLELEWIKVERTGQ